MSFAARLERDRAPSVPHSHVWGTRALNVSFSAVYALYTGFIGAPHIRAMTRLLGYQGIAVVIEELLKIGKSLVRTPYRQTAGAVFNKTNKIKINNK